MKLRFTDSLASFLNLPGILARSLMITILTGITACALPTKGIAARTLPRIELNLSCRFSDRFPPFTLHLGSSHCRAQLNHAGNTLCLPRNLWLRWLSRKPAAPFCGTLQGRWKAYSPPENDGGSKRLLRTFELESLPKPSSFLIPGFWFQIQKVREELSETLAPHDPWGIFRTLVLGERSSQYPGSFLRLIGFVHILGASGIHLYALALSISLILERAAGALKLSARNTLKLRRLCVAWIWLWAWTLGGCRIGMLRPLALVTLQSMSRNLGFRFSRWTPLILALIFALFLSLGWTWMDRTGGNQKLSSAFSLSSLVATLAAAGAISAISSVRESKRKLFRIHFQMAIGGWIFVALAQVFFGEPVALATPLISLLSLPAVSLVLYPWLILESSLRFAGLPFALVSNSCGNLILHSFQAAIREMTQITLSHPTVWLIPRLSLEISLTLSITAFFLFKERLRPRTLFVLATLLLSGRFVHDALVSAAQASSAQHSVAEYSAAARDVTQLDVGQGDSALVQGTEAGLIDAGSLYALNDAAWLRVLSSRGIRDLNWVALTHLDEDHRGGLQRLIRIVPIRCVATSKDEWQTSRGRALALELLRHGVRPADFSSCVPFPSRTPRPVQRSRKPRSANANMSAVLIPLASGHFYLSAGDAQGREEVRIARWADQWISRSSHPQGGRVLKISHHGSLTSTASETLRIFHPQAALISVGAGNLYGHPAPEILLRLRGARVPIHRTDQEGALRAEAVLHPRQEHRP